MSKDITEKGKFQSTLPASRVLWNLWYKTMIIVADYELEYKEELRKRSIPEGCDIDDADSVKIIPCVINNQKI